MLYLWNHSLTEICILFYWRLETISVNKEYIKWAMNKLRIIITTGKNTQFQGFFMVDAMHVLYY